jgi:hypothetical protein
MSYFIIHSHKFKSRVKKINTAVGFLFRIAEGHAATSDFFTAIPDLARCIQQNKFCYCIWLGGLEATQVL